MDRNDLAGRDEQASADVRKLVQHVSSVFIGKDEVLRQAILTLVAGGHALIEDVPGLGKTLLAKAIAKSISANFKRIQLTADLLPSDITGVSVFSQERHEFLFRPGPIFTQILLADEINRATPRTQSALLEAMEEHRVTVDGELRELAAPFFVMATQNPVELEGTYALPFAQMDRFMVRLSIGYMERDAELRMLQSQQQSDPLDSLGPLLTADRLLEIHEASRRVRVEPVLAGYLLDLVRKTRSMETLEYGASPRAALDLQSFAQAQALWAGRDYTLPDDIKAAARATLPHRLIIRRGSRSVTTHARTIIESVLESIPVPL
ncbi:MAG: MoxR family ATPase [Verrucomicrobia bacterium]|nr:MoxR family ATPase [Verrucomicrobiota bacterium]